MEDSVEKSDDVPNQNDKNSPKTKIESVCEIVSNGIASRGTANISGTQDKKEEGDSVKDPKYEENFEVYGDDSDDDDPDLPAKQLRLAMTIVRDLYHLQLLSGLDDNRLNWNSNGNGIPYQANASSSSSSFSTGSLSVSSLSSASVSDGSIITGTSSLPLPLPLAAQLARLLTPFLSAHDDDCLNFTAASQQVIGLGTRGGGGFPVSWIELVPKLTRRFKQAQLDDQLKVLDCLFRTNAFWWRPDMACRRRPLSISDVWHGGENTSSAHNQGGEQKRRQQKQKQQQQQYLQVKWARNAEAILSYIFHDSCNCPSSHAAAAARLATVLDITRAEAETTTQSNEDLFEDDSPGSEKEEEKFRSGFPSEPGWVTALRPELYRLIIERKVTGATRAPDTSEQHAQAEVESAFIVRAACHCLVTNPGHHNAWWRLGSAFAQLMHWTNEAFDSSAECSLGLSPDAAGVAVGSLLQLMRKRYELIPEQELLPPPHSKGGEHVSASALDVLMEPVPQLQPAAAAISSSSSSSSSARRRRQRIRRALLLRALACSFTSVCTSQKVQLIRMLFGKQFLRLFSPKMITMVAAKIILVIHRCYHHL